MKTLAGSFGGIERLKTARSQGIRSAPSGGEADAYLEIYMLLKKKQRLEKRDDQRQLEDVLKRIEKLQASTAPEPGEAKRAKGRQKAENPSNREWKVMSIDY